MLTINCKFSTSSLNCERSGNYTINLSPTRKQHSVPVSCEFSVLRSSETVYCCFSRKPTKRKRLKCPRLSIQVPGNEGDGAIGLSGLAKDDGFSWELSAVTKETQTLRKQSPFVSSMLLCSPLSWLIPAQMAHASEHLRANSVYEVGELFELGIQLSYLVLLLALLGLGSYFVIRQVLVRRELDLSAKELQEQVRSGDASATELFELGAVMLRRKFYPAAIKYLIQAIEKWDGYDQDLAQVYNALGVTYVRDGKTEKAISQFENAVKLQPGYVTAWNNLGDAYEKTNDLKSALKAFEEALLFDPNNKVARPRRDDLKQKVDMYKGVPVKSSKKK